MKGLSETKNLHLSSLSYSLSPLRKNFNHQKGLSAKANKLFHFSFFYSQIRMKRNTASDFARRNNSRARFSRIRKILKKNFKRSAVTERLVKIFPCWKQILTNCLWNSLETPLTKKKQNKKSFHVSSREKSFLLCTREREIVLNEKKIS